ncbi:MAG: cadherin-like domain-containing protein [Lysobacter sp.]|nr:cadherin-like domain-containing protein [Lysobacter sp.]
MDIRRIPRRAVCAAVGTLALAALAIPFSVFAEGTLIPAPHRVDMVHDDARGLVYITQGGEVLRYHVASGTFLSPIVLGGRLRGIDISKDNASLAVADDVSAANEGHAHLIALDDLAVRTLPFAKSSTYESGTFSVSFAGDGKVHATTDFWGSGWTQLRRLDPVSGTWTSLASVRQATMLSRSADGDTIAFAESNSSDGPWGLVDIPSGAIVRRQGYTDGTSRYNFEIGTDTLGSQFAIPTYSGTHVYDDAYRRVATIGQSGGQHPIGVAYHPVERKAYFPWSGSRHVRVYDMNSFTQVASHDLEHDFGWVGNHAYEQGRTKLSKDGSLLMVSVNGGVRVVQTYAPLSAAPASASAVAGTPVSIALPGSIGNGGVLSYSIVRAPNEGTVTVSGSMAVYTARKGYSGPDGFRYRVRYGDAVREAEVVLAVTAPNTAPVAANDTAQARRTSILIPVLANDSDADGDPLTITDVTPPTLGTATIESGRIRFTPPRNWSGSIQFEYGISDGRGGTARAKVTVYRF